jgi:GT2 family glycosyltransferase
MRASVVIPVRNRARPLGAVLTALSRQRFSADDFEIVVVDDGSTDETPRIIAEHAQQVSLVHLRAEPHDGPWRPGLVRNRGLEAARGDRVIFLDADLVPGRRFVHAHVAAHEQAPAPQVVLGYYFGYPIDPARRTPEALSPPPVEDIMDRLPELVAVAPRDWRDGREQELSHWPTIEHCPWRWEFFWGGNVSVPRDLARDVGGFDETFVGWGYEDFELGYRLVRAGAGMRFDREAWAVHYPHALHAPPLREQMKRANIERMLQKHGDPLLELSTWIGIQELPEGASVRISRSLAALLASPPAIAPLGAALARALQERLGLGGRGDVLVLGDLDAGARDIIAPRAHHRPFDRGGSGRADRGSFGLLLPYAAGSFADAVLVDYWRYVSSETVEVLVSEALRVANRLLLVLPDRGAVADMAWLSRQRVEEVETAGALVLVLTGPPSGRSDRLPGGVG